MYTLKSIVKHSDLCSIKFHLVILTARNNPLATSDREVGKDTVLLVFVPGVRLQTFALKHFMLSINLSYIEFAVWMATLE